MSFVSAVSLALEYVIMWVGNVVGDLVMKGGFLGELLPLLAVGVAVSALMLGIKAIRSFIWGS